MIPSIHLSLLAGLLVTQLSLYAVTQKPVTGQIHDNTLSIDPAISGAGDGGNRGEFTGKALMRLAQLWKKSAQAGIKQ